MMLINFRQEYRGNGPNRFPDEWWNDWKLLNKGSFAENTENFVLTSLSGESFVASKTEKHLMANHFNRYINAELKLYDIYEGRKSPYGHFILYQFKDESRRNEFILSDINGIATGSSAIHFEVVTNVESNSKRQKFDTQELELIFISYSEGLFPKPNVGELQVDSGSRDGSCVFYYEKNYFKRYSDSLKMAYNSGRFHECYNKNTWNNFVAKVLSSEDVQFPDKHSFPQYQLTEE